MNEELKKELERLNSGIEMLSKAQAVKDREESPASGRSRRRHRIEGTDGEETRRGFRRPAPQEL
ncbi:MAG: hypothetical protein IPJ30_14210 [Acidobacteria bacterium]|nr:hypothetical protein [Acidobacteriota bacterium]